MPHCYYIAPFPKVCILSQIIVRTLHKFRLAPRVTRSPIWALKGNRIPDQHDIVTADSTKSNLCLTPGCVHAASDILYNLSPDYKSIDPCANFEEFVCGGWKDRHDLREDQGRAFTGSIMIENTQMLVKNILEAPYPKNSTHSYFSPRELSTANSTADEQNFEKMKAVYDACLDEAAIKNIGVAPLMNIIREVERTAGADDNAVRDTIILLAKYRVFSLIYYSIGADDKAPDEVVVSVGAPGEIGLPSKERYEDDSLVKKYEDTLDQVLSALFPDHNKSGYAASAIVDLEKKLAAASPDTQERTDITKMYNPYSLSDAAALAPQIDLAGIISTFAPRGVNVDRLIVSTPKYMTALADILSETPKSTLQGYFIWKVVQSFAPYVEADAVKPCRRFSNQLLGIVGSNLSGDNEDFLTVCRILMPPKNAGGHAFVIWIAWAGY